MLETGFVLLTDTHFDTKQLITDLQNEWQLQIDGIEGSEDSLILSIDGFMCIFGLMPTPIPNQEAVHQAKKNYYCSDAVRIATEHQAHLMVTVANQSGASAKDTMMLYSKIICSCLNQENATGVYTTGTVYDADFYQQVAKQFLPNHQIPITIWVYVGFGQTQTGNQLYTSGMTKFGKDEMEILNSAIDIATLHSSLSAMCSHIINADLNLKDGETIGFNVEQKWTITRSKSVYADDEMSLKIGIN